VIAYGSTREPLSHSPRVALRVDAGAEAKPARLARRKKERDDSGSLPEFLRRA
jgi:hypothetical protein